MAERRARRNTNENRIRLKVKENPKYSIKYKEKELRRRDKRFKIGLAIPTLVVVAILSYSNIQARNELEAKQREYNELMTEVISQELKRDRYRARLENSVDMNRIQRYAIEELGMVYANSQNLGQDEDGN